MTIGVITSSPIEASVFNLVQEGKLAKIKDNVWLTCCGRGQAGVDEAILHMTYKGVEGLVSWGFAGGLSQDLTAGTVMLPKQIIHPFGPTFTCNPHWQQMLKETLPEDVVFSEGPIVHSDHVLKTPNQKQLHALRSHGICVDQESFYIAQWAQRLNLPFVAIRVILDDAQTSLPDNIESIQSPQGDINVGELFKTLIKPQHWSEFLTLKNQYHISQQKLKSVAKTAFNDLTF